MRAEDFVQPGDALLYKAKGVFGWVIALKTWHPIAHIEIVTGGDQAVASRDGIGVGQYALRLDDVARVLRPRGPLDVAKAQAWFQTVKGAPYGWVDLLAFVGVRKADRPNSYFCSEFATDWYRAGGFEPFQPTEDSVQIAPCTFLLSPLFTQYPVVNGEVEAPHVA